MFNSASEFTAVRKKHILFYSMVETNIRHVNSEFKKFTYNSNVFLRILETSKNLKCFDVK